MVSKICVVFTMFLVLRYSEGVSDAKSNVAFVIDDTGSMAPVIDQIIEKAQQMFKAIYSSRTSTVGDFILITFNDNEVYNNGNYNVDFTLRPVVVRTITRDPDEFLMELNNIYVHGGGTCPELCLRGIEMAILKSNPNSYIYVFTDASPRDLYLQRTIENLAQQKSIQITFILVEGICSLSTVYKEIAKKTSGNMFQLKEDDINQIIDYITACMQSPRTPLVNVPINPGTTTINITADNDMKDLLVMLNVEPKANVDVDLVGPDGNKTPTTKMIDNSNTKVVVVLNPKSGVYTATVDTDGTGEASIKATISIDFKHGFSLLYTTSLKNTDTRPIPGEKSYLLIQLVVTTDTVEAKLKMIQILDMDDKVLMNISASVINEKENIYISSVFKPPDHIFKIAVIVIDHKTGDNFKRICRTPVQPQARPKNLNYKRPIVTIENSPEINLKYGESIILECKVKAYPKPTIVWEDKETGGELPSKVSLLKLPYDYISYLEIKNIEKVGFFKCKATSSRNEVITASIKVETFRPRFLKIIESPKDSTIEYEKDSKVHCKIDAWPPGYILWYKNSKEISNDNDFEVSDDNTTLLIKKMRPELEGPYSCRATNNDNSITSDFTLSISGVESPEFDKSYPTSTFIEKYKASIYCRIIKGSPSPEITWQFKKHGSNDFISITNKGEEIQIDSVEMDNAGIYKCHAKNLIGEDYHEVLLVVQSIPQIDKKISNIIAKQGRQMVHIPCRITKGSPEPDVTWKFKKKGTTDFVSITETTQLHTIDSAGIENEGLYRCTAKNVAGEDSHETELTVQYRPVIDKSKKTVTGAEGATAVISCRILRGIPKPQITWKFKRQRASEYVKLSNTEPQYNIDPIDTDSQGTYKCYAKNAAGEDSHETEFIVHNTPIVNVNELTTVKIGETVTLTCDVSGNPKPNVKWIRNGTPIEASDKFKIFSDNSLRFTANRDDGGNYTCYAENRLGSDTKNATLDVYGPIKIEVPEETLLNVDVGSDVKLPCKATGIPKPFITWEFICSDPNVKPIKFTSTEQQLVMRRVQTKNTGYYKCAANNRYDEKTIAYQILVNVPVEIEEPKQTKFIFVKGDFVLKIPCKAKGYPKPKISWIKNFHILTMGDTYTTDSDGTLIIKNPDESSAGKYLCVADNDKTYAHRVFTVDFTLTPKATEPTETVYIEEGTSTEIKCKIPHKSSDTVRWYTNGKEIPISANQFILRRASEADSGDYTCHVSSLQGSSSTNLRIKVGAKPYFENKKDSPVSVAFIQGRKFMFECFAKGKPPPMITWWHNGEKLKEFWYVHTIYEVDKSHLGEFRCEAKNDFGIITRSYVVEITGCRINYNEKVTNKFHPVLLSSLGELAAYENQDGVMILPENELTEFVCPNNIRKVYCSKNEYILTDNTRPQKSRYIKYADLKCNSEVKPSIGQYTLKNQQCSFDRDSRLVQVGYEFGESFCVVYDVCINKITQKLIFLKYDVTRYASNIKIDVHPFDNRYVTYNYDDMYNCPKQKHIVGDKCCFVGKQLVNPQDVSPVIQKATYFNINVVPQWNFCGNNHNFDEVEKRIRDLAKSIRYKLQVFSSEFRSQKIFLQDINGKRKTMPQYLWKVVQVREIGQALAIVTINVPNLKTEDVAKLVFCQDICYLTDWMNNIEFQNVLNGYTFCCKPRDFAKVVDPMLVNLFKHNILLSKNIK